MFTAKGKIKQILEEKLINEKYKSIEILLEVKNGEYTNDIGLDFFGDKAEKINGYKEGEEVEVSFNVSGRFWKDRIYNNLRAWKIQRIKEERKEEKREPVKVDYNKEESEESTDFPELPF